MNWFAGIRFSMDKTGESKSSSGVCDKWQITYNNLKMIQEEYVSPDIEDNDLLISSTYNSMYSEVKPVVVFIFWC